MHLGGSAIKELKFCDNAKSRSISDFFEDRDTVERGVHHPLFIFHGPEHISRCKRPITQPIDVFPDQVTKMCMCLLPTAMMSSALASCQGAKTWMNTLLTITYGRHCDISIWMQGCGHMLSVRCFSYASGASKSIKSS
jgi:hypothetical protein